MERLSSLVGLVFLAAVAMWLGTAALAMMSVSQVRGDAFFYVSAFFGCFVTVGLQLASWSHTRKHLDRLGRELAALRQQLAQRTTDGT